jgi:glutathione S-transferase
MVTLYHAQATRSHLVRFALFELDIPHETVRLDVTKGEHKGPDYLKVNPLGQLPALVDDGHTILECGAIILHLSDKATAGKGSPALGTIERASLYQWVFFGIATQLFALSKIAMHTLFLPEPMRKAAVADEGYRTWPDVARALSNVVRTRTWLVGDRFTVADVVVGGSLWLGDQIKVLADYPDLLRYYERIRERPAFQRGFAD